MRALAFASCLAIVAACGPSHRKAGSDAPSGDGPSGACAEGTMQCAGTDWQTCSGGVWSTTQSCPVACVDGIGCAMCSPGAAYCNQGNVWTCDSSGNGGTMTTACTGSQICSNGACVDACADAATNRSYIGCEYWAVDLENALEVVDLESNVGTGNCSLFYQGSTQTTMNACTTPATGNPTATAGTCDPPNNSCPSGYACRMESVCVLDAQHSPFAIIVSNPQNRSVDVTVTAADGTTHFTTTVAAGAVQPLSPQSNGMADQSLFQTGKQKKAYKVTSTLPIVAYQFQPLDNVNVFSNGASLLLPRTAWDIDYYGMTWPTTNNRTPAPGINEWYGYLSVVSYKDGTVVAVTPTANVQASASQAGITAGTTTMFTLNAYEVLNLDAVAGGDLTGTTIHSVDGTTAIGAYGGHVAAYFGEASGPSGYPNGPCCADHMESQTFPNSTWGKTFAVARSPSRGTGEKDVIKVLAQKPGTTVTFNPAPTSGTCGTLAAGQFCQVKIDADTSITGNNPILVGHFLESAIWQDSLGLSVVGTGDPDGSNEVPVEQYRTDYTLLIPNSYNANYFMITAPPTGGVFVDGTQVTMNAFAGGTYRSATVSLGATGGSHTIHCPNTCGVMVINWSDAVSSMYAGGLDLKQIVIQ